ncbi:Uncharacterized conserved protein, MAPEG superfamily [Pseudomonas cuatrocienegasensis]|uniref:Uncharacterized conserved protein, MAPEG superfamily n=1 Tax=Pseudomonas cuatrocienegasensis TaxID=543360 RepID=A0ABY1B2J0_9PSED|nr:MULTISPECIES: MAPEG family protein [Pseudomonas]OEC36335.1 hypothetical protein A7D25_04055 [Pseudomonas sp. 21C1]SEP75404.1 Uncharacterized conserved protein, MAPEG superfamily [Pseudomonas cuatrocienegasensis]
MSIPFWCLFITALLIYVAKIPVAKAMNAEAGGYDNQHPRAQQAKLTGLGARALAAHLNTLEIFPLFAAGVLMAHVTQMYGGWVDALAVLFVIARVLYLVFYWQNLHWQRSLVWILSLLCCLLLMLSPAVRWLIVSA